jgi:hypothetical protein
MLPTEPTIHVTNEKRRRSKKKEPRVIFKGPRVSFDEKRALEVFTPLQEHWNAKRGIFEGIVLPQDRWSGPSDPKEKALFLFNAVISQRGGIMSEDPMKVWTLVHRDHPGLFDPREVVAHWTAEKIAETLRSYLVKPAPNETQLNLFQEEIDQTRKKAKKKKKTKTLLVPTAIDTLDDPTILLMENNVLDVSPEEAEDLAEDVKGYKIDEHAVSWYRNSLALKRYWDGDVRNVFYDSIKHRQGRSTRKGKVRVKVPLEFEEVFSRIDYYRDPERGFYGMRRKITSLWVIWMQEKGLAPLFPAPIPVDFHALRVLLATGIVRFLDAKPIPDKKKYPPQLRGRTAERITEAVMDEIAIWSQKFFVKHGLSHMAVNPALWILSRELCRRQFQNRAEDSAKKYFLAEILEAKPHLWPSDYADPCVYCPVETHCERVAPSAPYYKWGWLVPIRRVDHPEYRVSLPGLEDLKIMRATRNSRA